MEPKTERVPIMLEPSFLREIDDYRFQARIGSRSEAVRALLRDGLEVKQTAKREAVV